MLRLHCRCVSRVAGLMPAVGRVGTARTLVAPDYQRSAEAKRQLAAIEVPVLLNHYY